MQNLRKLIREILEEALKTFHFKDRVLDRLESEHSTFANENDKIKNIVNNHINYIESVNFPGQDNIGVLLFKSPNKYVYHKLIGGKTEHSEGNFIWLVVRANDLETIVFGDASYRPLNTQINFRVEYLMDYINTVKGGDKNLTEKDIQKIKQGFKIQGDVKETPKEEIFLINGTKWVPSEKTQMLTQKNNPSKSITFDQAFDLLSPEQAERLLSLV